MALESKAREMGLLQWGRAYSARRITARRLNQKLYLGASMGPGLFSPENLVYVVITNHLAGASMGPGLFSPEN